MKVYEPQEDSYLLQKYVLKYCNKKFVVLDMCTGSGIQAITAAKIAEKVMAVDINKEALSYAESEAKKETNITFIHSDLFEKIPNIKFDLIIFNLP